VYKHKASLVYEIEPKRVCALPPEFWTVSG
jgi:hypothetical protein